jgi:hypothetical protein
MAGRTADTPLHLIIQEHRIPLTLLFRSLARGKGEEGGSDRVRLAGFFPTSIGFFDAPAYDRGGGDIGWAGKD